MRILLADDQDRVRYALRVLLAQQPGLEVVAEVFNAADMLAQLTAACPDLALLDWELPGLMEAGGLAAIRKLCPHLTVTVLSGRPGARRAAGRRGRCLREQRGSAGAAAGRCPCLLRPQDRRRECNSKTTTCCGKTISTTKRKLTADAEQRRLLRDAGRSTLLDEAPVLRDPVASGSPDGGGRPPVGAALRRPEPEPRLN